MTSESHTFANDQKFVMFITYPDGSVQSRFFADMTVLATWTKTMATMQSLAAIEKYDLFPVAQLPANAELTTV